MEKTVFTPEPLKTAGEEEAVATDKVAQLTPTQILQHTIDNVAKQLMQIAQASGQINMLEMQIQNLVAVEHLQLLTALIIDLSNGKYNDDTVTLGLAKRLSATSKILGQQIGKPVLAQGVHRALNGNGKH
jgi:hypothetical protein